MQVITSLTPPFGSPSLIWQVPVIWDCSNSGELLTDQPEPLTATFPDKKEWKLVKISLTVCLSSWKLLKKTSIKRETRPRSSSASESWSLLLMSSPRSAEQVEGKHLLSTAWLEERKLCGQEHRGDSKCSAVSFMDMQAWEHLISSTWGNFNGKM